MKSRTTTKLIDGMAEKISVPEGRRDVFLYDQSLSGFYLRVYDNGRASYGIDYYVDGKRRRLSLGPAHKGTLSSARKHAADVLAKARLGSDAMQEREDNRERGKTLFGELASQFLQYQAERLAPRTHVEWTRHLTTYLEAIHNTSISDIERRDLVEQIDRVAKSRGTTAANHCRATLSVFYAWCVERQLCEANPVIGISKRATIARTRILDNSELAEVWKHAGDGNHGLIVKMLILTAQRRNEIGSLQWPEIDFSKKLLNLPPERVKNRRAHSVPLSSAAMSVLGKATRWEGGAGYVFGDGGRSGYSGWSKSKSRLDSRINKAREDQGHEPMPDWTLHDLRRSAATGMAALNIPVHVAEKIMNHVSGSFAGIVGVYQRHTYEKEMREALETWGNHIISVCEASPACPPAEQAINRGL